MGSWTSRMGKILLCLLAIRISSLHYIFNEKSFLFISFKFLLGHPII